MRKVLATTCSLLLFAIIACRKEIRPSPETNTEVIADPPMIICISGNCWIPLTPYPQTKPSVEGIFTINGVTYLSYENYDPAPDFMLSYNGTDWSQTAFPTTPQDDCPLMFSIGNKGYALFSNSSSGTSPLQEFDPTTGVWTNKGNYPGNNVTPMYTKKAFVIGNNAYVMHHNSVTNSYELWKYNQLSNTWTQRASLPKPSGMLPVDFTFALGAKGHIMFKVTQLQSIQIPPSVSLFYSYDTVTNVWTSKTAYPGDRRYDVTGFVIGSYAYVGTGKLAFAQTNQNTFYRYNTGTNQWTSVASYSGGPTSKGIGFNIGSYGYLLDFYNLTLPTGGNYFYRYKTPSLVFPN